MKVIFGTPEWHISGSSSRNSQLLLSLLDLGWDASILLTSPSSPASLSPPSNVPQHRLDLPATAPWDLRWHYLRQYLEASAPCIYLPGYDFLNFPVIPLLGPKVRVVGSALSDEAIYYRKLGGISPWLNGVIAVSSHIGSILDALPSLHGRVRVIHSGIRLRPGMPEKSQSGPLRLVYAGRIKQAQKRVLYFPTLMRHLMDRGVDAHLDIVGDGEDMPQLQHMIQKTGTGERISLHGYVPSHRVLPYYDQAHVLVLLSDYEGLSLSLLEGMEAGCVPVITRTQSGATEAVSHGHNGLLCPMGDLATQADAIASLYRDRQRLQEMAHAARATISSQFSYGRMVQGYDAYFRWIVEENSGWQRPPGKLIRPREVTAAHQLASRIRNRWKRLLKTVTGGARC